MRLSTICAALILASSVVTASPLPLEIALRADIPKTLPGIPIDIRLTVTNTTASEVQLDSDDVMIRVERAGQAPFWVFDGTKRSGSIAFALPDCANQDDEVFTFPPRSRTEYAINGNPDGSKSWWEDPRLNVPGVYRMELVLNPPKWAYHSGDRPEDTMSEASLGPQALISNSVTFVVEEPHGDDAAVWGKLSGAVEQEARGTEAIRNSSRELARNLLDTYPDSRYAPWLAYRLITEWDNADERDAFLKRFGRSPLTEVLDFNVLRARSDAVGKLGLKADARQVASIRGQMRSFRMTAMHPFVRCSMNNAIRMFSDAVRSEAQPKHDAQYIQRRPKDR